MTTSPVPSTHIDVRALFVHAHPDDEAITTGGTIAVLVAAGVDVRVVTCTLGEEGEVLGEEFAGLTSDRADQLGGYRIAELSAALRALGVDRPRFLGDAGRWRDSGMAGTPSADHPRAFVGSGRAAVEEMAGILDGWRPDLVVTYDPRGGYGHPDHVRAHEVVHAALGHIDWTLVAVFATTSVPLSFLGARVAMRTDPHRLERIYGMALIGLGTVFLFLP